MNRRTFMKGLSLLLFLSATGQSVNGHVAQPTPNGWASFDPNNMYGMDYIISDEIDPDLLREVYHMIKPDIEYIVPPGYRSKVSYRYKNHEPNDWDPLQQRGYFYWVYKPKRIK